MAVYTIDINKKNFRTIFKNMIPLAYGEKLIIVQEKFKGLNIKSRFFVENTNMILDNYKSITSVIHLMSLDEFVDDNGLSGHCEVLINEEEGTINISKNFKSDKPEDNELTILSFYSMNEKGFNVLEKNPFITENSSSLPLRILNGFSGIEMLTDLNSGIFKVKEIKFNTKAINDGLLSETYRYKLVNVYFNEAVFLYYTEKTGEMLGFTSLLDKEEDLEKFMKESYPEFNSDPTFKVMLIGTKNEWTKKANDIGLVLSNSKADGGHYLERYLGNSRSNGKELNNDEEDQKVKELEERKDNSVPLAKLTPATPIPKEEKEKEGNREQPPKQEEHNPSHPEPPKQPEHNGSDLKGPHEGEDDNGEKKEENGKSDQTDKPKEGSPTSEGKQEQDHTKPESKAEEGKQEKHNEPSEQGKDVKETPSSSNGDVDPETGLPYEIHEDDDRSDEDLLKEMEAHKED